jgi:biuret amidohydrolase
LLKSYTIFPSPAAPSISVANDRVWPTVRRRTVERITELDIPHTLEGACNPRRMALLVYDMQVGIVSQLPHGPEIQRRVGDVLSAARDGGFPVFFSRHMSLPKELMGVFQRRQAMSWQRLNRVEEVKAPFPQGSPQWQIVPELEPLPSEAVSDKIAMSAFEGTFLDVALRDLGIVSFAICGIATEVGIEPTVRHGADLGYIPVIVEDACGAGNEEAGRRSLEILRFAGDAIFTDAAAIGDLLRSKGATSA